jgi:hypothetical protein
MRSATIDGGFSSFPRNPEVMRSPAPLPEMPMEPSARPPERERWREPGDDRIYQAQLFHRTHLPSWKNGNVFTYSTRVA